MSQIWTYLSRYFLQLFLFSLASFFIAIFVIRLEEIMHFAILSPSTKNIFLFALCQIPTFLALIIPISALIASYLLMSNLSKTFELTALRSGGVSLFQICSPLLFWGALLSIGSLLITCDLIPHARTASKQLAARVMHTNPLSLVKKESPLKIKNAFVMIGAEQPGKRISDVLLITKRNEQLNLFSAKELKNEGEQLLGKQIATIGTAPENVLIVENYETIMTPSTSIAASLIKEEDLPVDHRTLHSLLQRKSPRFLFELFRRLSLSMAPLTLTLLGIACGISIEREPRKQTLLMLLLLTTLFYVSFFTAKRLPNAQLLFLIPHLLIPLYSLRRLQYINRGVAL